MFEFIERMVLAGFNILNSASAWLVFSFILAGVLHDIMSPDKFQRMLGNKKLSSLLKSTISGMLLPICSCGVIPLGISLYYSGAYLGPVLAFMTATPIINPIAVILCYGLLGPQITMIYVIAGFAVPMLIGIIGNMFAGPELVAPGVEENIQARMLELEEGTRPGLAERIRSGLNWAINDLALAVSKYVIPGMLFAGFLLTAVPQDYIQRFLGNPNLLSLGSIAVLATIMYVCAVGHIPFIAALIASGAAPGVGITFLMAGAATNFPELISMLNLMGKRTAIIYSTVITLTALAFGYVANLLLMPDFEPAMNFDRTSNSIKAANTLLIDFPKPIEYMCSFIIFVFFLRAVMPGIKTAMASISKKAA